MRGKIGASYISGDFFFFLTIKLILNQVNMSGRLEGLQESQQPYGGPGSRGEGA